MACTLLDCAQCCTIFSILAFFFLLIIAGLLTKQPLYFKGIKDASAASKGCYTAALIYLGVIIICVAYWSIMEMTKRGKAALAASSEVQLGAPKKSGTPKKSGGKKKKDSKGNTYGAVVEEE